MFIGAKYVLAVHDKRARQLNRAAIVAIIAFIGLTVAFLARNQLISLEPNEIAPYAYTVAIIGIGAYSLIRLRQVARLYPLLKSFVTFMIQATILIIVAALPNIFYDVLGRFGVDQYQVIYLSHFTFYAALSLMFLAYGDSLKIGGLHADIRKAIENGGIKM